MTTSRTPKRIAPLIETVKSGGLWHRIHPSSRDPKFFGPEPGTPPRNRFDAPGGEYRVLYAGQSFAAAFAERFLRVAVGTLIPREKLDRAAISAGHLTHDVRVVRLHGQGLFAAGTTADVVAGPHDGTRALAASLWNDPAGADGLGLS